MVTGAGRRRAISWVAPAAAIAQEAPGNVKLPGP